MESRDDGWARCCRGAGRSYKDGFACCGGREINWAALARKELWRGRLIHALALQQAAAESHSPRLASQPPTAHRLWQPRPRSGHLAPAGSQHCRALPISSASPAVDDLKPSSIALTLSHSHLHLTTTVHSQLPLSNSTPKLKMPPKAQKTPTTGGKAPAGKAPAEKKEAGKKTAAPSGDKKKRTKTRKETYSSYIYKGEFLRASPRVQSADAFLQFSSRSTPTLVSPTVP